MILVKTCYVPLSQHASCNASPFASTACLDGAATGSNLGKTEIGELDDGLGLVEITVQQVFRLEISMDDPVFVAVEYCLCHLYDAISRLVFCVVVLRASRTRRVGRA